MEEEIILTDEENEPLLAFSPEQGVRGVQTTDGPKTWAELEGQGALQMQTSDGSTLPVLVQLENGFLTISVLHSPYS